MKVDILNIIHVIVGLNVGGAELMLKRLILSSLDNPNYQHSVISLTELGVIGRQLQKEGVSVIALNMESIISLPNIFLKLRSEIKKQNPSIVQTWMYHADFLGGIAAKSLDIDNIVWGIRTTDVTLGGSKSTVALRKLCALLSYIIPKRIVCAADAGRKTHERIGYDASKMNVIHNGFELNKLKVTVEQKQEMRDYLNFADDEVVIGSIGRFNSIKNQKAFIEAAAIIAIKYPKTKFLIVGRDNDWNNPELVKWIREANLQDRFVLLGERTDVPICMAAIDIFCLHSKTEGFPNVLGEAMAMMKPCVATDVGDSAFLLGKSGIIVPKESSLELANGVERLLLLSSEEIDYISIDAQERIRNNFTMEKTKQKFDNLYQALLADT